MLPDPNPSFAGSFATKIPEASVDGSSAILVIITVAQFDLHRTTPQSPYHQDFLAHVDAEDLRLRFFARIAELSAAELDALGHFDYRHAIAFIALDEDTSHMLGLIRLKDELDEKTAEFAILVRSRLEGRGLGLPLMRRVIDYAKEKGMRHVYGDVLAENTNTLQTQLVPRFDTSRPPLTTSSYPRKSKNKQALQQLADRTSFRNGSGLGIKTSTFIRCKSLSWKEPFTLAHWVPLSCR